jgi:hypothetical protein
VSSVTPAPSTFVQAVATADDAFRRTMTFAAAAGLRLEDKPGDGLPDRFRATSMPKRTSL